MRLAALVLAFALIAGGAHAAVPADLLYGTAVGKIVTIDTVDGVITDLQPLGEFAFRGLSFEPGGRLFASACPLVPVFGDLVDCASAPSNPFFHPYNLLVELDPATGAVLEVTGPMTDAGGIPLDIAFLASPPGSTVLYGIDLSFGPNPFASIWRLWAIDPDTAAATLVADRLPPGCEWPNCSFGTGLAGHPDGSLAHVAATGSSFDPLHPPQIRLVTLDPETGAELTSLEIEGSGDSIAVRSDGTIFTAISTLISNPRPPVRAIRLATIDPETGSLDDVATSVGAPIADLAFSPLVVAPVEIDVRPLPFDWINLRSHLPVAVALFGSESIDVREVDVETLVFEGAGPLRFSAIFDVDHDDHDDLVVRFRVSETTLVQGRRQEVCLTGAFHDGQPFAGCDVVDVVSFPACGLGFELALVLPLLMAIRGSRRRPARMARR